MPEHIPINICSKTERESSSSDFTNLIPEYNEYTKKMEPHYDTEETENITKLKTIKSTNGVIELDYNAAV